MKLTRFSVIAAIACLASPFLGGCSDDEGIDNRDLDYGYVQFKLYKDASYSKPETVSTADGTRAIKPELDYLSEASKIKVTLSFGETTIAQTLTLTAADKESAEFGMRSEKLKLLTGAYEVVTFALYDANDELIYNGTTDNTRMEVVAGGLTVHDLTVDVEPRGSVKFTLVKDIAADLPTRPDTRAVERQYTFDEIKTIDITVQNKSTNAQTKFEKLKMEFSIHFDDDDSEDTFGYQTSSSKCDSLLSLPAGDYRIVSYQTYDTNRTLLETNNRPKNSDFTVEDNLTTDAKMTVTLYESDEYIKDCYALYEIWKALDGPNWSYQGQSFPVGCNWDFNKDPDLWYDQPGVEVHSNGRVAKIVIGEFGYRGHMPAAIGQLSEMIELFLGNYNDTNSYTGDPSQSYDQSLTDRTRNRMEYHKQYLAKIHPATQLSEPFARQLLRDGIRIPANSLYEQGYTEDEIIDRRTGLQKRIRPLDMNYGKLTNGLKSLPKEIGNLKKLENLSIANCELEELPEEMAQLESCTDLVVYNCPKMKKFPMSITQMPKVVSLNISNNAQWSAEEVYKGLDALAKGPLKSELQIFYARQNNLEEVPESFSNFKKLGMLDLSENKISKLHPLGKDIALVELHLDDNLIEEIPTDADGIFCKMDDMETMSATNNKLKLFPDIFTAKTKYGMKSVDFSNNEITGFSDKFQGVRVETLTLAGNPLTEFPTELGKTNSMIAYIILRACNISKFPEGAFTGKHSSVFASFDLSYNKLTKLPDDFSAKSLPYLYGVDLSYNALTEVPFGPLNCAALTLYMVRGQRDAQGNRCLRTWPKNITKHTGLRVFYIGSNDIRKVDEVVTPNINIMDISDNPNIIFDASGICYYWQNNAFLLTYDKTQHIIGCDAMLE